MGSIEKSSKCEEFRSSQKEKFPKLKDYSKASNEQAKKHIRIMSEFRPNSEMPGNDR